jgi:hypothetical protein
MEQSNENSKGLSRIKVEGIYIKLNMPEQRNNFPPKNAAN